MIVEGLIAIAVGCNVVLTYAGYRAVRSRLILLQDDLSAIRIRTVPVDVGGRLAPSQAELQAARNRMDKLGVAHPGGPG
jgi:hypothetical protein